MKKITLLSLLATASLSCHAVTFNMWGTHGASIDYDSESGVLTAFTGRDANFHWNKSNWANRTGKKAFFSTADFNSMTVENALTAISWEHVAGSDGDIYFNIMVEDSGGHKAILAPRYYGNSYTNTTGQAGFVTNDTQNWFSVFEAEAGWTGTSSTGAGVATWSEIKDLTITTGPFAEFPDTLTGAAKFQNDPVYQLSNWANWAADSGSTGAHQDGVLITFGQSTGNEPPLIQIGNIQFNGEAVDVASNNNSVEIVPASGALSFTAANPGQKVTAVANQNSNLTSLNVSGGSGSTIFEVVDNIIITLEEDGTAEVGSGGTMTGTGSIVGNVTVASGGVLKGKLSVSGNTTLSDGATFAPGFSPGAVYSGGTLTASDGSTIQFELGGLTAAVGAFTNPTVGEFDQLFYAGDVTFLNGSIIEITPYDEFELSIIGTTFDLVYSDGTIVVGNNVTVQGTGEYAGYTFTVEVLQGQQFQGSGSYDVLRLTLVPEPAAYTAIAASLTLGLVFWRRKRVKQQA